ncbi:MAG: GNAT family N-acetyltransferase [Sterolibacteriaceae bacterium]|nr:GNAT family N-acetyltransferase [Candidatus Methylophosphatis haderslevensis]
MSRALTSDSAAIAEVHVRSWQGAYCDLLPADYLQTICVAKREADWAARLKKGDSVVGQLAQPAAEIMAFYVSPPHWGKGIGRSLWLACLADLVEAGFDRVTLWVLENNRRGIH